MNDVKYRFLLKAGESTGGLLPYGYQHVEYLQSSGTQYIDTGLKPIANEVAEVDFRFTSVPSSLQIFFGSRVTSSSKRYLLGCTSFSGVYKYYCALGNDPNVQIANVDTQRHTLTFSTVNGTVAIDGGTAISAGTFIDNDLNIHVFGLNQNGTSYEYRANMRIYGVRLGTRSRLVPARRLFDNVLGMYDTRRNVFLTNAGTGTFTAGAVVEDWTEVHPVWKDDLSLTYERESGQMFMRTQLSGNIVLVGRDYDTVMAVPFGEVFHVKIQRSVNFGESWTDYWQGRFYVTDCTVNADDRRLTVKPTVDDRYVGLLRGWEKEYDLIRLTPAMQRFLVRKRPMIQIYTEGDRIVSCFMGRIHFEQDADLPSDVDNPEQYLRDDCHFNVISSYIELNFTDVPTGQASHFAQPYTGVLTAGSHLTNTDDSTYYIEYYERVEMHPTSGGTIPYYINGLKVCPTGSTVVYWQFEQGRPVDGYMALPVEITLTDQGSHGGDLVCIRTSNTIYGRVVCNVDYLGDEATKPLYNNDLVAYNRNYRRATGYWSTGELTQTAQYSTTPTKWGLRDDGTYFVQPDGDPRYIPIGQSLWVNSSMWFMPSAVTEEIERMGRDAYTMNNAYPLASCISVLLAEMGAGVTFADSPTYSEFLFNTNQQDPIAGRPTRLYLTPKSNITAGEYQTPAQTAPTTLRAILDALRQTYRLYWFVDESNRLRIEHIEWFRRGGTYSGMPSVGIDLTELANPRNGKPWSFGTSEYKYERIQMPDRYEFEWMDKVTDPFKGQPINILSPFVEEGKKEEVTVSGCSTDVDFMLLSPSTVSPEGFVLMTGETASAVSRTDLPTVNAAETLIVPVAKYVSGKACTLQLRLQGSGTATIVWYVGSRRVVSSYVLNGNVGWAVTNVTVPDGTRGMSFLCSAACTITVDILRPSSGDTMLQMPFVDTTFDGVAITMQNGELSFLRLQDPYWLYDMPAKRLEVNGTATTAEGVSRMKRQTLTVPVGVADPVTTSLVRTAIGDGTIYNMSVRLTSRTAKITLEYDTEELQ